MTLNTPDAAAAQAFYGELLGWEFEDAGAEHGQRLVARRGGKAAAGVNGDHKDAPFWGLSFATEDCAGAVERAATAGAAVDSPAAPFPDPRAPGEPTERRASLTDPQGAPFGLWEGPGRVGAEIADAPGALVWNELVTSDTAAALRFYDAVFGVTSAPLQKGVDYHVLSAGGRPACGVFGVPAAHLRAAGGRAAWKVYFGVENADRAAKAAAGLGGRVVQPAMNSPFGRFAVLTDPSGAEFAAISVPKGGKGGPAKARRRPLGRR
ncbi:VOC family protein [Actinocorallia aurea]